MHEGHAEDPFDQQQLTRTLGQLKATLVEYSAGPRDMFAFIVNDSGLRVVRLGDRQKISAAAADLHDRLLDPESPRSDIRTSARQLAELVLWPLTAQLGAKRLIFVPDEGLHTIPFNILPWSANGHGPVGSATCGGRDRPLGAVPDPDAGQHAGACQRTACRVAG